MAQQPIHFYNFSEGLYSDVSPILVPENALYAMSNVNVTYKIGSIIKRCGYEVIGAGALETGRAITGLHNFRQSASVQKMLATVTNATPNALQLFYSTGGNWTEVTDAETAWANFQYAAVEMADFVGYCFFVGYRAGNSTWLPVRTLTGTTFGTTNTTDMPNAKYIVRYRDRLYLGNCYASATAYPYRVYYSNIPSGSTVAWTPATNYFDVDFSEAVTGLASNWDRLIVFTEYSAYLYNQSEKKQVWDIGCSQHRTIKNSGAYTIWANMDGVWVSTGGRPENIAGRVIDFIRAADMRSAFSEIVDEEYHLYLGLPVTVNGISYSYPALIYNIPTKTWRIHDYAVSMSALGKFYSGGEDYLYMGASAGFVYRLGKYTDATLLKSDAGSNISPLFQSGAISAGDPSISKNFNKIITFSERGQGLNLKARIIDKNVISLSKFEKLGEIKKYVEEFQVNPPAGNLIQIEGTETGQNEYWSLFGFTINVDVEKPFKN